jgi:hypothetical protein
MGAHQFLLISSGQRQLPAQMTGVLSLMRLDLRDSLYPPKWQSGSKRCYRQIRTAPQRNRSNKK